MDFVVTQVLLGGVLPGAAMLGAMVWLVHDTPRSWSWAGQRGRDMTPTRTPDVLSTRRGIVIVLTAAVFCAVAFACIFRPFPLRPTSAKDFAPWLVVPALLAGMIAAVRTIPVVLRGVGVAISLAFAFALAHKGQWKIDPWIVPAGFGLAFAFLAGIIVLSRRGDLTGSLACAVIAVLSSVLFMLDFGSTSNGQIVGTCGAILSACVVSAWWRPGGGVTPALAAFAGTLLAGCFMHATLWGSAASNRDAFTYCSLVAAAPWAAVLARGQLTARDAEPPSRPSMFAAVPACAAGLCVVAAIMLSLHNFVE